MKRHIIKIEGTDHVKERLLDIENSIKKMREDIIRLENEPLMLNVEEVDEYEKSSTDN